MGEDRVQTPHPRKGDRGVPRTPRRAGPVSWPTSHSTEAENGLERAHTHRGLPPAPSPLPSAFLTCPPSPGPPGWRRRRATARECGRPSWGWGGAERGQEMEGKKDSVRHSVSQSSRAVGKLDTVPGGGKRPFMPCEMWGSQNQDPSRLGSEAGDAVPSWATSLGQPLNRGEW